MRAMTRIASGIAVIALLASPALPVAAAPPQSAPSVEASVPASIPVTIEVDAGAQRGPLKPIWRFFGADDSASGMKPIWRYGLTPRAR